ncbi:uncharacterized protein LOC107264758 isoform X2 [Cephus cinctus]|nr:uncharacterized protein LOC107264758 isoform X2 [Cephus cinctus]XP_015588844.1 uncharacterized protein LOC107264758 isoform X2 [Cephus cinctus]
MVQVTNCGSIIWNVVLLLDTVFNPLVFAGLVPSDIAVASFLIRCAKEKNGDAYNLQFCQNCWVFERQTHLEELFKNYYFLDDYLSIVIKYKLFTENLKEFKSSLIKELIHLQQNNTSIKLMFYCGNEIFYTNHTELHDDFRNCRLLSSALATVVKQSLNDEFRETCLNLLKVDNSYDAETVIMSKLLTTINENYVRPERKASTKNNEPDNDQEE